jgi:hypothetical protein
MRFILVIAYAIIWILILLYGFTSVVHNTELVVLTTFIIIAGTLAGSE